MTDPKVIYEDDTVMILDKPAGWVVNDAKTAHKNPIVQNWLKQNYLYGLSKSEEQRSGVVHRLDKETSGILVIAKTRDAFDFLQEQFKDRKVEKEYVALVHGKLKNVSGVVNAPLGRLPWNRERFGVLPSGKSAETVFEVDKLYRDKSGNFYSLLKLRPKTGRTHQIRIHLKHLGHPIVSDSFYAGRKTSRQDKSWCSRLFLHAYKICFQHPQKHTKVCFESQLSPDLASVLTVLTDT